jgi:hypothetical protein
MRAMENGTPLIPHKQDSGCTDAVCGKDGVPITGYLSQKDTLQI